MIKFKKNIYLFIILIFMINCGGSSKFSNYNLEPLNSEGINNFFHYINGIVEILYCKNQGYINGNIDNYLSYIADTCSYKKVERIYYYNFLKKVFENINPTISDVNIVIKKNNYISKLKIDNISEDKSGKLNYDIVAEGSLVDFDQSDKIDIVVRCYFKIKGKIKGKEKKELIQKIKYKYNFKTSNKGIYITDIDVI